MGQRKRECVKYNIAPGSMHTKAKKKKDESAN